MGSCSSVLIIRALLFGVYIRAPSKINMEAHRRLRKEDSSLPRGPFDPEERSWSIYIDCSGYKSTVFGPSILLHSVCKEGDFNTGCFKVVFPKGPTLRSKNFLQFAITGSRSSMVPRERRLWPIGVSVVGRMQSMRSSDHGSHDALVHEELFRLQASCGEARQVFSVVGLQI